MRAAYEYGGDMTPAVSAAPIPQGDAPPIPAWLIEACPSHVWVAAWEACAKQQAAALAASEARANALQAELDGLRKSDMAHMISDLDSLARAEAAEQSLAGAVKMLANSVSCVRFFADAREKTGHSATAKFYNEMAAAIDAMLLKGDKP